MEALVPGDTLDGGNDDNHMASISNSEVPSTQYEANAVPTMNHDPTTIPPTYLLERSPSAADCLPQSRSSFAHTAPTMGDGGQRAPGQRATTGQRATPKQCAPGQRATTWQRATPRQRLTSEWMTTLTGIGGSLSNNMSLWLDFAIMSIEQLLNVLQTIRTAYRESAIVGRDGLIESEAVSV